MLIAAALSSCGAASADPMYTARPATYLLSIDELQTPDFTVSEPVHSVVADWLGSSLAASMESAGFQDAAQVLFFRTVGVLGLSNGPTDARATVARFGDAAGAQRGMAAATAGMDGRAGAAPVSTGPLGDSAHATSELATFQGVEVVQITVVWRVANLLNTMVIHGRYGGARLDDALNLAHRQTENILRGGPPLPTAPARPSATVAATPSTSPAPTPTATTGAPGIVQP